MPLHAMPIRGAAIGKTGKQGSHTYFWLLWKDNRITYIKNYTGSGSGLDEIWKPDLAL